MSSPEQAVIGLSIIATDTDSAAALTRTREGVASIGTVAKTSAVQATAAFDRIQSSLLGTVTRTQQFESASVLAGNQASLAMAKYETQMKLVAAGEVGAADQAIKFGDQAVLASARAQVAMKEYAAVAKAEAESVAVTSSAAFAGAGTKALSSFKALAGGLLGAVAITGGVMFAADAVKAAGADAKSQYVARQTFGENAEKVNQFSDNAAGKYGLSTAQANTSASAYGRFLGAVNVKGDQAADLSTQLVGRASDLAKADGVAPEEVEQKFLNALKGRGAALKLYGVDINPAVQQQELLNHGLISAETNTVKATAAQAAYNSAVQAQGRVDVNAKSTAADREKSAAATLTAQTNLTKALDGSLPKLDDQQKALGSIYAILDKTNDKAGSFADSSDMLATRQQILKAKMDDLAASVGKSLLPLLATLGMILETAVIPMFQLIVKMAQPFLDLFAHMPKVIQEVVVAIGILLLLRGPLTSFFTYIATGFTSMSSSATSAISSFGGMKNALMSMGTAIAVTMAVSAAIDYFQRKAAIAKSATDDLSTGQDGLVAALQQSKGAWDNNTLSMYENTVAGTQSFKDLLSHGVKYADAMDLALGKTKDTSTVMKELLGGGTPGSMKVQWQGSANDPDKMAALSAYVNGLGQQKSAAEDIYNQRAKYDEQTNSMTNTMSKSAKASMDAQDQDKSQNVILMKQASALSDVFGVKKLMNALDQITTSVLHDQAEQGTATQAAIDGMTNSATNLAMANQNLSNEVKLATAALDDQAGRQPTYEQALSDESAAIDALGAKFGLGTASARHLGAGILYMSGEVNTATQAGRELRDGTIQTRDSIVKAAQAAADAGMAHGGLAEAKKASNQAAQDGYNAFISETTQILGSRDAAIKLAAAYGLVPKKISTVVDLNVADANNKLRALISGSVDTGAMKSALDFAAHPFGAFDHKAMGGEIMGGSGNADDVPIMGMGGEFMVNKTDAQANMSLLQHINNGGKGYAGGGAITANGPDKWPTASSGSGARSVTLAPGAIIVNIDASGSSSDMIAQFAAQPFRQQLEQAFLDDVDRHF